MENLKIYLLGQFQVLVNGTPVYEFASDKVRALLAYLASENHVSHRRETLANLLWPDKPDSTARASLRRALANLRQVIGDQQAQPPHLLITHQDIQFNPEGDVWFDGDALTRLHTQEALTVEDIPTFDQVLDLYRGEFLVGFSIPENLPFDEWVLIKREQYARKALDVLLRVCRYQEARRDYDLALPFAWRIVELEPWQEKARRQLMRLLVWTGRRDEALQQYQALVTALKTELDIAPEPKTTRLYQSIQEGEEGILSGDRLLKENDAPALPVFLQKTEEIAHQPPETFVARQEEIAQLHTLLDDVIEGKGTVAMITGEAGSGKSMLFREFVSQAQTRHPDLVSATGHSNAFTGVGDPYLPFREILYRLSGDIQHQWKAGAFSQRYALNLWAMIPAVCQSILNHGPDLVDTLIPGKSLLENAAIYSKTHTVWFADLEDHVARKSQHPGSGVQQANLFSQYGAVLQNAANHAPLLLVLDDLQWADTGTIGMLFYLAKQIPVSRIMLLGAYRSEEVRFTAEDGRHPLVPVLHEIQRDYGDMFVNLDASTGEDFVRELIASEPNDLDTTFRDQLYNLTDGHALFTFEILLGMQDTGALMKDGRGRWVKKLDFQLETLPPRVEGIIAERIGRLSHNLQRALTVASIEGEEFTAEILAGVDDMPVSKVISLLSDQLDRQHRLVRAQQISRQGKQTISTYRFRHFLFQKYMYERLDEIERVRLHQQVGTEMEKMAGEAVQDYSVQLARHFHRANLKEKAVNYYSMAGGRAIRMSAFPEAINHFESAIELLHTLPESSARDEQELGLQLQLGVALQAIRGFAEEKVGQAFQCAWELCQSVENYVQKMTTMQLLYSYYANMAEFDTAYDLLSLMEKSIEEAEIDVPEFVLQLFWGYGYLDSIIGRHQPCLDNFEKAIKYYNQILEQTVGERVGMEPGIYCHSWAGLHATWLGYPDKAKAHIQSAFNIAERYNSKPFTNDALWFSTWTSLELQDMDAARKYNQASLELCIKENYFLFEAMGRAYKGRILSRDGKHQEAVESIQQGLNMFHMVGAVTAETMWLHALAETYCAAGMIKEGLDVVLKSEQFEQKTGEARHKPAIQRIKGDLHLLNGNETAAEQAYLDAIATAQEQSAKLLELEAVKRLAHLWHQQGKTEQAISKLTEIFNWFTEGFDTPMLIEAKELLEALD